MGGVELTMLGVFTEFRNEQILQIRAFLFQRVDQ